MASKCNMQVLTNRAWLLGCALMAMTSVGCGGTPTVELVPALNLPIDGGVADNGCTVDDGESVVWDFDWSDVPGATTYELWIKHRDSQQPDINRTGVETSSYRVGRIAIREGNHLQGWEWKVRAQVKGADQPWSKTAAFTVEPPDTDCQ